MRGRFRRLAVNALDSIPISRHEIQSRPVAIPCPDGDLWRQFPAFRAKSVEPILHKSSTCHAVYCHLLGELRALRELNRGFGFGDSSPQVGDDIGSDRSWLGRVAEVRSFWIS